MGCLGWIKRLGLFCMILSFSTYAYAISSVTKQYHDNWPTYPKVEYGTGHQADLIKKGEYLVKAGDCIACHTNTKAGGKPFAGGLEIKSPFGVMYTPNITPDKKDGIGAWSDADFIRAMTKGISPEGKNYYPAFPFKYFSKLHKQDLLAIRAYLNAIPAEAVPNKENDLLFPFSWRVSLYGWKILYFYFDKNVGPYKYDPEQSKAWNRGAYIVQGLGHCAMCHTPHNFMFGAKTKYNLTGAFIQGFWAPNITEYGLKTADKAEVANVFDKEKLINQAGPVRGPMSDVDHDSLKYLSREDLLAISTYLKTYKPDADPHAFKGSQSDEQQAKGPSKERLALGEKVYYKACVICHDSGAAGAPKLGDAAQWGLRLKTGLDTLYKNAINGFNNMPPKGACVSCSDNDIEAAVDYILAKSKPQTGMENLASAPKPPKKLTMEDGKKLYGEHCAACHDKGLLNAPITGDVKAWEPLIKKNMDVLIEHAVYGFGRMPAMGACKDCTTAEVIAATKYMVQESSDKGNYSLW